VAHEVLGVLEDAAAIAVGAGIFALGFEIGAADLDGFQFVGADAAVEDFLFASFGVEKPLAIGEACEGMGKGQLSLPMSMTEVLPSFFSSSRCSPALVVKRSKASRPRPCRRRRTHRQRGRKYG